MISIAKQYFGSKIQTACFVIRFKEVKTKLDQQYDLLRLIVAKMEIKDEADQLDEGCMRVSKGLKHPSSRTTGKERGWLSNATIAKVKAVDTFGKEMKK